MEEAVTALPLTQRLGLLFALIPTIVGREWAFKPMKTGDVLKSFADRVETEWNEIKATISASLTDEEKALLDRQIPAWVDEELEAALTKLVPPEMVLRSCEGGGPENRIGSLCLTLSRWRAAWAEQTKVPSGEK